jgi:hypothetical protein
VKNITISIRVFRNIQTKERSMMSFELSGGHITANPDFNGPERKARAVFMANLLAPGVTMPNELNPHNGEPVTFEVAPDVSPQAVEQLAKAADFIVRYS